MAAWDEGFLQKAVDQCTNPSGRVEDCPIFDLQSEYESQQCTFQPPAVLANDNPQGPRHGLPGNVPIFNPTVIHSNVLSSRQQYWPTITLRGLGTAYLVMSLYSIRQ